MVPIAHHEPTATVRRANAAHAAMATAHRANVVHARMATVRRANAAHAVMATDHKASAVHARMATGRKANAVHAPMATARKASAAHAVMATARKANAVHARMATARKANAVHAPMATARKASEAHAVTATARKLAIAPIEITPKAPTVCSATSMTRCNKSAPCNSKRHSAVKAESRKTTELAPANASMVGITSTLELSTTVKPPARHARLRAQRPSHLGASRRRKSKTPNKSVQENTDPLWRLRSNTTIAVNHD